MRLLLLTVFVLVAGCSRPDLAGFKQALDEEAQNRGMTPLPTVRAVEPQVFNGAKLADPFYPRSDR